MSDINPDFSFPSSSPRSAQTLPPPPINSPRPVSFSPQSPRQRKHAHRRSAALSEDFGVVEPAILASPQMPTPSSFTVPPSPGSFGGASVLPLPVFSSRKPQFDDAPNRDSFDPRAHVQVLNSPLPKQKSQIGEPGQLVALPSSTSPSKLPLDALLTENNVKSEKSRKRRSFVQLLRKSRNQEPELRQFQRQPLDSLTSPLKSKSEYTARISPSPPQSPSGGDDTLIALAQLQPPLTFLNTPVLQQAPVFSGSPVETPRNSGEIARDNEPLPPTINLNEALSCSFSHRMDTVLESPFSKASSIMSAVLEEDEDEREPSGSDSQSSIPPPPRSQRPSSFLHKTNSVSSTASTGRMPPASPRLTVSTLPADEALAKSGAGSRTISYVGPVTASSTASSSPSRSPRVSFEQVSNLAILDPAESLAQSSPNHSLSSSETLLTESAKQLDVTAMDPPQELPKNGHQRRRSLIDRLMRRAA